MIVEQTAQNLSASGETKLATWSVDKSQSSFPAIIVFLTLLITFVVTFLIIFVFNKSTNLFLLIIPIIMFLLLIAAFPELLKSLQAISESSEVYLTERGVYKRNPEKKEEYHFIAWDLMSGYDMKYFQSPGFFGKLFNRPTKFLIKSKYEDDSFWLDAFGDDVDILRAYLKEHNVPFGFLKK